MAAAGIIGGMIGPLTEGMASAAQYQAAKHERNVSWRRQQQWELIGPSLRVAGLRAAGLNPILAATQGMTGGPGHVATASPGSTPRFSYDHSRAMASAKQAKAMDAQIRQISAQADEAEQRAAQATMETRFKEDFGWDQRRAELANTQQHLLNMVAEMGLSSARSSQSDQERLKIHTDRMLMEMGIPGARAMEEMYEKYPLLRQLREFSGGGLGPAAIGAGAGALLGAGRKASSMRKEDRHKVKWGRRGNRR